MDDGVSVGFRATHQHVTSQISSGVWNICVHKKSPRPSERAQVEFSPDDFWELLLSVQPHCA